MEADVKIPSYRSIKMSTFKEVDYELLEVRKYEDYVMKFLSFKLNYFTTFNILEYLILNGIAFNNDFQAGESASGIKDKIKKMNKISFQVLTSFVEDINYVNFNHIEVAFSCITFAREVMRFKAVFHPELEKVYNIKMGNFLKCYHYLSS